MLPRAGSSHLGPWEWVSWWESLPGSHLGYPACTGAAEHSAGGCGRPWVTHRGVTPLPRQHCVGLCAPGDINTPNISLSSGCLTQRHCCCWWHSQPAATEQSGRVCESRVFVVLPQTRLRPSGPEQPRASPASPRPPSAPWGCTSCPHGCDSLGYTPQNVSLLPAASERCPSSAPSGVAFWHLPPAPSGARAWCCQQKPKLHSLKTPIYLLIYLFHPLPLATGWSLLSKCCKLKFRNKYSPGPCAASLPPGSQNTFACLGQG